jgi:uncharacterized protein YbjT (DUF2867 family)
MSDDLTVSAAIPEPFGPELGRLLHPARYFRHPREVLHADDIPIAEKRAILSSWASDACAVESAPALRQPPGADSPVPYDDIIDALQALDGPDGRNTGRRHRLRRSGGRSQSGPAETASWC